MSYLKQLQGGQVNLNNFFVYPPQGDLTVLCRIYEGLLHHHPPVQLLATAPLLVALEYFLRIPYTINTVYCARHVSACYRSVLLSSSKECRSLESYILAVGQYRFFFRRPNFIGTRRKVDISWKYSVV